MIPSQNATSIYGFEGTSSTTHTEAGGRSSPLIALFDFMQVFGLIGCTAILSTALLSRHVQRHSTWINFCATWIFFCLSFILLFLGGQQSDLEPTSGLCFTQAVLVYAAPPLASGSTLSLVIHLWFNVRCSVYKVEPIPRHERLKTLLLLFFPYPPSLALLIGVTVMGLVDPTNVVVSYTGMYCEMRDPKPGKISAIYVALVTAGTGAIEGIIATALYRNWRSYTCSSRHSFAMIVRVVIFNLFVIAAIGVSLVHRATPFANILMATMPVVVVLVFGSQLDILRTWMFWRSRPMPESETKMSSPLRPLLLVTRYASAEPDAESILDGGIENDILELRPKSPHWI